MNTFVAVQTLVLAVSLVAGFAQPLPFDLTPLQDAVQDGTGRVWAIGRESGLFSWENGKWEERELVLPGSDGSGITTSRPPGARPLVLQTNCQGDVYVLWSRTGGYLAAEDQFWISKSHGADKPVSAPFRAWLTGANLMFEPTGAGWMSDAGPRIYRVQPDLRVELAYTISSDQMAGTRFDLYDPVQATLDSQGRVLFWGEQRFRELATLRGLLIASDGGFAHHPKIEGLPDRGFSSLAMLDGDRLWVGLPEWDSERGLFELDLKSMRATKLPEPEPGAFTHIASVGSHLTIQQSEDLCHPPFLRPISFQTPFLPPQRSGQTITLESEVT